jgi:hypothetical protein
VKFISDFMQLDTRALARVSLVFVASLGLSTAVEILLNRAESLLAFAFPLVMYILVSLRLLPSRTPVRMALSGGMLLGSFVPFALFMFGLS